MLVSGNGKNLLSSTGGGEEGTCMMEDIDGERERGFFGSDGVSL